MRRNVVMFIIFGLVLNISVGIMQVAITDSEGNQIFTDDDYGKLHYDENTTRAFSDRYQKSISAEGGLEDKGLQSFRLLDLVSIGWLTKITNTLEQYLFGMVKFLRVLFWDLLAEPLRTTLFVGLYAFFSIAYIIAVVELWTNRKVAD